MTSPPPQQLSSQRLRFPIGALALSPVDTLATQVGPDSSAWILLMVGCVALLGWGIVQARARVRAIRTELQAHETNLAELQNQHSQELQQLRTTLQTSRQLQRALLGAQTDADLCQEVCAVACGRPTVKLAWMGRLERKSHTVEHLGSTGELQEFLPNETKWRSRPFSDLLEQCLTNQLKTPLVVSYAENPDIPMERVELARKCGIEGLVVVPILLREECWGILMVYASSLKSFESQDLPILWQTSGSISITLDRLQNVAKLRAMEHKLRHSEDLLERTNRLAGLGGWEFDSRTLMGWWTRECARIHGEDYQDQVEVSHGLSFFFGEYRQIMEDAIANAIHGGFAYDVQVELVTRAGQKRWVRIVGQPVIENGQTVRVEGLIQDLTEERKVQDLLQLRSTVLEAAANAIVITDVNGMVEWTNPAFTRLTGYSGEESLGRPIQELLASGQHSDQFYTTFWRTILSGQTWQGEFINRRKDGRLYHEEQVVTPVFNRRGQLSHFIAIKQDVTQRKVAEAALLRTQRKLAQTQALAQVGGWEADLLTETTTFSPEAALLLGIPEGPMRWMDYHRMVLSEDLPKLTNAWWECRAGEGTYDVEYRVLVNNQVKWIHERGELTASADGHTGQAHGMLQDITHLREVQAALEAHRSHLEDLVTERTRQLENARAEAIRLSNVKTAFLANMSHEIRTPLNGVLGFAQLGMMQTDSLPAKESFSRIVQSGQLLIGIINDILDFSKIEAGKLKVELRPTSLRHVLHQATSIVEENAQRKGLTLNLDIHKGVPGTISADPLRLSQVLINLLNNAVKFTESGSVTVQIARDDDTLILAVIDTGIGLSSEHQARLFRPFEQADDSTTRRFGGTGLGLAISFRLVHLMRGELRVQSALDKGSRFEIRLPLISDSDDELDQTTIDDTPTPLPLGKRLVGVTVLAAEDNETNRLVLQHLFLLEGADFTLVNNGREAVDCVMKSDPGKFDIILMDVQMPEMDGYQATEHIKAYQPGLPIVGLTAHATWQERERCLKAGMVEHVAKPPDLDLLVRCILRLVGRTVREAPSIPISREVLEEVAAMNAQSTEDAVEEPLEQINPIVWAALEKKFRGGKTFVQKLVRTALESLDRNYAQLNECPVDDFTQLAFVAHTIKGAAANIGAEDLRHRAAALEEAARDRRTDTANLITPVLSTGKLTRQLLLDYVSSSDTPAPA